MSLLSFSEIIAPAVKDVLGGVEALVRIGCGGSRLALEEEAEEVGVVGEGSLPAVRGKDSPSFAGASLAHARADKEIAVPVFIEVPGRRAFARAAGRVSPEVPHDFVRGGRSPGPLDKGGEMSPAID